MRFNSRGHELPDPTPVEVPLQFSRPPTLQEQIKRFVRQEWSQRAAEEGHETFEEADDFDVEDDPPDPQSQWEIDFEGIDDGTRNSGSSEQPGGVGAAPGPASAERAAVDGGGVPGVHGGVSQGSPEAGIGASGQTAPGGQKGA